MYYPTFYINFCIIIIKISFIETGDTNTCTDVADCTQDTTCIRDVIRAFDGKTDSFCIKQCTIGQETEQCGMGETCETVQDITNTNVLSCVKSAECIVDNYCLIFNPNKPICNLYTLKCVEQNFPITPSTTTKIITTTTPCTDLVSGGQYDCKSHLQYCKNPVWLDLMKSKCAKTCGYCGITSENSFTSSTCNDASPKCSSLKYLCKNSIYRDLMKKTCPKTCEYC